MTRGERELVIAEAKKKRFKPLPKDWEPPTLAGGTQWVGGSLSREELYGDDGR